MATETAGGPLLGHELILAGLANRLDTHPLAVYEPEAPTVEANRG